MDSEWSFLRGFSLILKFFPKDSRGGADMLFKIIAERGGVFKAAGESDFRDGVVCRAEHLNRHPQPVPEKILLGRGVFMLHKDLVQIGAVYAYVSGYVGDPDIIAVVVLYIFFGRPEVFVRIIPAFFQRGILHKGEEQEQVSDRLQLAAVGLGEGSQEPLHAAEKGGNVASRVLVDKGSGEDCLLKDFRTDFSVKADPGVAPGIFLVSLIVGGFHGGNEKGVSSFQMIGNAALFVDPFSL